MQELLAVFLAQYTFAKELAGAFWSAYVDNQGVLGALRRSSCTAPDINMMVGRFWLRVAEQRQAFFVSRVESEANVADGPTRDSFDAVRALGGRFVRPVLPDWLLDVWEMPQ